MKLKLWEYYGKDIELIDYKGKKHRGHVTIFEDDTQNNDGKCSIVLKTDALTIDFSESEIKSIKEIE
jgi:hypothetical protein